MFTIHILDNLRCFWHRRKQADDGEKNDGEVVVPRKKANTHARSSSVDNEEWVQLSRRHKIGILPAAADFNICNLYPSTDHVEKWTVLVVGSDKTYILANVQDELHIPDAGRLLNCRGADVLPPKLQSVFDGFWDKTLGGKQLQLYLTWDNLLYLVNTYPFFNGQGKVIGAALFMRQSDSMPDEATTAFSL